MNTSRRQTLQAAGGAGLYGALVAMGVISPSTAFANVPAAAFQAKTLQETLKALGVQGTPAESKDIVINAPEIAENGAVVPVSIKSNLPKTEQMALLVEKNPNQLAGAYEMLEGASPEVSMRIKMGETSDVTALVKADGKYYMTRKEIKVTLGGCGG